MEPANVDQLKKDMGEDFDIMVTPVPAPDCPSCKELVYPYDLQYGTMFLKCISCKQWVLLTEKEPRIVTFEELCMMYPPNKVRILMNAARHVIKVEELP